MSYSTFYLNTENSGNVIDGSNVIIGGNIGIKTIDPQYDLDVSGSIYSESIVTPSIDVSNILLTDSNLNPYSIQSRVEHTKRVDNIVTVGTKTSNAANSSGSNLSFFIDNIETPFLHFIPGKTYRFIQEDSTNTGHPFRFYLDEGKTTQYTTNFAQSGTPGSSGAYVDISATTSTPQILYYQSSSSSGSYMGNRTYTKATYKRASLDVDGSANFTGDVSMNDVSMNGGLTVGGDVAMNNNLTVDGDLSANDASFNVIDVTSIGIGTTSSSYKLNVNGTANFTGDVSMNDANINGSLSVVDNVSMNNNLTVDDNVGIGITASSNYKLTVDGSANFTGDVSMNNIDANGTLSVIGDVSINTLKVNGDLSANDASFNGIDATSIGIGTIASSYKLNVNGTANFTSDVSMNDVSMNGSLAVVGDVVMNNNLTVDDNVGIGITASTYKLNVDGTSNFTGDVSMNNINANGTLSVIGDVSINTLKVNGDLSANDASFNVIDATAIGIGTAASSYKLNVGGTANVTGDYLQNGTNINTIYATLASPNLTGTPLAPTASSGTNTTQIATTAFVSTAINNLIGSAPGTLDTLEELALALDNSHNYASAITTKLTTIETNLNTKQNIITETDDVSLNTLKVHGDLSANDASFNVIDVTSIGIGTTASSYKLNVDGTANFTGDVSMNDINTNDINANGTLSVIGDVSLNTLKVNGDLSANDASFNVIDATSIGIGTTASSYKLNVDGTANFTGDVSMNDVSMNGWLTVDGTINANAIFIQGNEISSSGGGGGGGSADITESSITDLSDVDISYSNITNGAYLIWNDNTKKWGVLSANETTIRSSEEVKVSHSSSDIQATTSSPGEIYLNSSSYVFDKLFDGGSGFYHSTQVYTGTDNVYSGNSNNVTNNYTGAWVQQQYNSAIYFTKFKLEARSGTNMQQYAPEELKVFVGNDGTNWTEFHDFSKTDYTAGEIVTENFASTDTAYTYIRFVFHKSLAQQYITFVELEIFGNKETTVSQTSNSLLGLSDVDISYNYISDGQALIWNDASGVWNPGTVASSSGTTIDSTTDISVNNLDISGVLATNKSNNQISLGGHIIPITNSTYDLGSAEYKIRHLYLSNNSLWLGEDHKIEVSDGKMKFRKLQKDALPSGLNVISGASLNDAITILGKSPDTPASSFTLADWEAYSIAKGSPLRVDEIFLSDDINDDNGVLDTINGLDISLNVIDASRINVSGDISANDASFNVLETRQILINGEDLSGTIYTKINTDISTAISNLVDNAPLALDTLNELAQALNDDANFYTTFTNSLNSKQVAITETVDVSLNNLKVHGDLSANDASFNVIDVSAIFIEGSNVTTRLATIETDITGKQDTLTAGTNITITGNTISASGSGGSADITESSITDLSDVDISYNDISDGQVLIWNDASGVWNSGTVASVEDISGLYTQLASKQDTLTAGTDISITNNTISYTGSGGGGSSGGSGISSGDDVSFNNVDISGVLATNKSNNQISLGGHIIPITNSTYDLGSAEYKIRHLYLSDNSLWLGEDHKIEVSDGKMKFRKLQKDALPSGLNVISGASLNDAITILGKSPDTPASSFTLADWEAYSIAKGSPLRVDEIFLSDDINDDNGVLDTINGLDISLNVIDASRINVSGDISVNNLDVSGNLEIGSVITAPATPAYTISYEYHNWDKHGGGPFVSNHGSNNTYKTGSYLTSDSAPDRMQTDGLWSGANTQTFNMKDISGNNGSISNVAALFYRGTSSGNTLELSANGVSSSVSTSQQNDTGYTYYFELRDPWSTPSAHRHPIEYIIAGTEDDLGTTREFIGIGTTPTSSHVTEINNMNWKIICRYHFTDDDNYWNSVSSDIYDPDANQLDLSYCTVYDSGVSFTDINGRNTQVVGKEWNKYYYVLKTTTPNLPLYKGFCVFIIDSTTSNVALKSFNIQVEKLYEAVSEQTEPIMSVNNTKCHLNLPIDISGTVKATGSITANTTITNSDDRLKHNEKHIENAISIINKLNPMRYFKTAELKDKSYNFPLDISGVPITTMNYHEETGIIAQDIHTIPELSHTLRQGNNNVPYGIDYNSIFCTHIAATKELYSIINNQKLTIETQEQEIENLKLVNQDMNNQLNTVLNENNTLKDDIIFIKNYLGIN